jgi:hypothetical protein
VRIATLWVVHLHWKLQRLITSPLTTVRSSPHNYQLFSCSNCNRSRVSLSPFPSNLRASTSISINIDQHQRISLPANKKRRKDLTIPVTYSLFDPILDLIHILARGAWPRQGSFQVESTPSKSPSRPPLGHGPFGQGPSFYCSTTEMALYQATILNVYPITRKWCSLLRTVDFLHTFWEL